MADEFWTPETEQEFIKTVFQKKLSDKEVDWLDWIVSKDRAPIWGRAAAVQILIYFDGGSPVRGSPAKVVRIWEKALWEE
jgi:hypothetical protein